MAVTIAVPPAQVVNIIPFRGDDLIKKSLEILNTARFELQGCDPARRGGCKNRCQAILQAAVPDATVDLGCDIDDITMPLGFEWDVFGHDCDG